MKYRTDTADGDYTFGRQDGFLVDSPATVALAITTRLRLWLGEWFLDDRVGVDYLGIVLGRSASSGKDIHIQDKILGTTGVLSIEKYSSSISEDRVMTVAATVVTEFGTVEINVRT